jgi:hypothetical protein
MSDVYENYALIQWINKCDWKSHPLLMSIEDLRKIDKHEFMILQLRYLHD